MDFFKGRKKQEKGKGRPATPQDGEGSSRWSLERRRVDKAAISKPIPQDPSLPSLQTAADRTVFPIGYLPSPPPPPPTFPPRPVSVIAPAQSLPRPQPVPGSSPLQTPAERASLPVLPRRQPVPGSSPFQTPAERAGPPLAERVPKRTPAESYIIVRESEEGAVAPRVEASSSKSPTSQRPRTRKARGRHPTIEELALQHLREQRANNAPPLPPQIFVHPLGTPAPTAEEVRAAHAVQIARMSQAAQQQSPPARPQRPRADQLPPAPANPRSQYRPRPPPPPPALNTSSTIRFTPHRLSHLTEVTELGSAVSAVSAYTAISNMADRGDDTDCSESECSECTDSDYRSEDSLYRRG